MKFLLALLLAVAAFGQVSAEQKISYSTDRKTVQYIVIDLAKLVGLGYNWDKSANQTDPERRVFVDGFKVKNETFDHAMHRLLGPVHLRYAIEGNRVVLYRE